MECPQFEKLELSFVEVRQKRLEHLVSNTLTTEMEEQLSRAELKALYDLLDHRADHRCQQGRATRLPASRNIGGIIGPY